MTPKLSYALVMCRKLGVGVTSIPRIVYLCFRGQFGIIPLHNQLIPWKHINYMVIRHTIWTAKWSSRTPRTMDLLIIPCWRIDFLRLLWLPAWIQSSSNCDQCDNLNCKPAWYIHVPLFIATYILNQQYHMEPYIYPNEDQAHAANAEFYCIAIHLLLIIIFSAVWIPRTIPGLSTIRRTVVFFVFVV